MANSLQIQTKESIKTSNNQRLEKCVRCVLLLYNWYMRVFLTDHLLHSHDNLVLLKFTIKQIEIV